MTDVQVIPSREIEHALIRVCPSCESERPLDEDVCANETADGVLCRFPLFDIQITPSGRLNGRGSDETPPSPEGQTSEAGTSEPDGPQCPNGHAIDPDDAICLECGAPLHDETAPPGTGEAGRRLGAWSIVTELPGGAPDAQLFLARRDDDGIVHVLRYFHPGVEPDPSLYAVLEALDRPDIARLVDHGRVDGRAMEVWEHVEGRTLGELRRDARADQTWIEEVAVALIRTLAAFERRGLRHGDLQPSVIRVRSEAPLALCVTDLASARIAEFDVESSRLRQASRYMAPEAVAEASTAASDWWSLGIILLEMLTDGACFEGVHERAFLLHLVTRGVTLPEDLSPRWRNLLDGLLTRHHEHRWRADQALRWADGETDIPTRREERATGPTGPVFHFAGQRFTSPEALALAAAEASNWDEARAALDSGSIATWLTGFDDRAATLEALRAITSDQRLRELDEDVPLAFALGALNPDLPLCIRGELVREPFFQRNPETGARLLEARAVAHLRRAKRPQDKWLVDLADRAARVRARAKEARITLSDHFEVAQLTTSPLRLQTRWRKLRALFPDSANRALASLMDRHSPSDEELLLLVSAQVDQFRPAEDVIREAERLAAQAGLALDREEAVTQLARPRHELAAELEARAPGFERCGRPVIDEWMDTWRAANRRMPLARLLVVLSVPAEDWAEPPHQDYVRNVMGFLERRVVAGIQRGPLIQMRAGASVIDVTRLGDTELQTRILDAVIGKAASPVEVARATLEPRLVASLQTLARSASTFYRDTGLRALHLAFPILTLKESSATGVRTRIAPVILWPIAITVGRGAAGTVSVGFDSTREPQLNPALETVLGADGVARWQDLLCSAPDGCATLLRAAAEALGGPVPTALAAVPTAGDITVRNKLALHPGGAVLVADFPSQAIAGDLKQLPTAPLEDTALAHLLRLGVETLPVQVDKVPHGDRYATLEADPSQEEAVFRARHAPGLVVQGPPGTGKSQTIVNIVADCMGRGEKVLVVCEKKAALDVVQKRLAAEKLDHRVARVESTDGDRRSLLQQLLAQVQSLHDAQAQSAGSLLSRRRSLGGQLDALEAELDAHHEALTATDESLGLSYRQVLSIVAREAAIAGDLVAPGLRPILGALDSGRLEGVIGECRGLVEVWLAGAPAAPALAMFRPFATDAALAAEISDHVAALHAADERRIRALTERQGLDARLRTISCPDAPTLGAWLATDGATLESAPAALLARVALWRGYFAADGGHRAEGEAGRRRLAALIERLDRLSLSGPALLVHAAMRDWSADELRVLARALTAFRARGMLARLDVVALLRRSSARSVLARREAAVDRAACLARTAAAHYETTLRTYVEELREIARLFGSDVEPPVERRSALDIAQMQAADLDAFGELAARLDRAPVASLWPHAERLVADRPGDAAGVSHPLTALLGALRTARAVAAAGADTLAAARRLSPYLTNEALTAIEQSVATETPLPVVWPQILAALPALAAFQTFRLRQGMLSEATRTTFDELASMADRLRASGAKAPDLVAALMRGEAASQWKADIETRSPRLQQIRTQIDTDIAKLEELDREARDVNRWHLAQVNRARVGAVAAWAPLCRATGPNQLRLREVFERGRGLGLLDMWPVWLVNPDVASRLFPLQAGLFDVVVFDEASQMRVVSAAPSLYRARRAVVSGDEKQLPPTSFFGAKAEEADVASGGADPDDWADAPTDEGADAEAGAGAIDPRLLEANERHIRDCEDLLTLASGLLPSASLDIHYRSAYRELIAFSNAAYYGGKLNVPVRRPVEDVRRARPIEVRRVDGLYQDQSNADEAAAVVDLLAELWGEGRNPPTVGIVTFNMKQAELIETKLRARADEDRKFERWLDRERARRDGEEDVGFFVKNLESVQGDERDWIIFSTTFGRDDSGVFKRAFGALNQDGGERRLNVAVTRAKRKVVLVTSMPTAEISSFVGQRKPPTRARDYLQAYMRYAELVHEAELEEAASLLGAFDSTPRYGGQPFETPPDDLVVQVLEALRAEGFAASLMPLEDAFSVEIAVTHPETGLYALGVEIDSPSHRLLRHARAREVWRPKLLARSGMRLHRIPSSAWVQDPAGERARLLAAAHEAMMKRDGE